MRSERTVLVSQAGRGDGLINHRRQPGHGPISVVQGRPRHRGLGRLGEGSKRPDPKAERPGKWRGVEGGQDPIPADPVYISDEAQRHVQLGRRDQATGKAQAFSPPVDRLAHLGRDRDGDEQTLWRPFNQATTRP